MSSYKDTRILGIDELRVFFEAVDRCLATRASVVIIGGAAAAFHRVESTTSDVDILRGVEHDMQQLEEVRRNSGFDFDTLVDRFGAEMGVAVGDPQRIRMNFLELIERLFGEIRRVAAEQQLVNTSGSAS